MKLLRQFSRIFTSLTKSEKLVFSLLSGLRILSSFLDILALIILGVLVSQITGGDSPLGSRFREITTNNELNNLSTFAFLSIGLFALKGLISIVLNNSIARYSSSVETRKSSQFLAIYLASGLEKQQKFAKNRLNHALIDSSQAAYGLSLTAYSTIIGEGALALAIGTFLAAVNFWAFMFLLVIFGIILLTLNKTVGRRLETLAQEADHAKLVSGEIITDIQNVLKQIITQNKVDEFARIYSDEREKYAAAKSRSFSIHALPRHIIELGLVFGLAALSIPIYFGAYLDASTLTIFLAGAFRLVASSLPLQNQVNVLKFAYEESRLALSLEDLGKNSLRRDEKTLDENLEPVDIKATNLGFSFSDGKPQTLRAANFTISFGSFVLVEGKSGSGKSTLADLILGLREPTSGQIDFLSLSKNVNNISLTPRMAYVPQKVELVRGPLRQNITFDFSSGSGDDSDLYKAIKASELEQFVEALPQKLDTWIDKGMQFSGGQIQRIGLARALITNPSILVIDEGTSALDRQTESAINSTLIALKGTRTVIVISHSKSLDEIADIKLEISDSRVSVKRANLVKRKNQ